MRVDTGVLRAAPPKVPPNVGAPIADDSPARGLGTLKVLIVEDESIIAWALESLVEDLGHEVVAVAASGEAAIASAAEHRPELILMDINLGRGLDGIEAAERIQAGGRAAVIFVSAYCDEATLARIRDRVPGSPLLTKPVSPATIQRAFEDAMGGTRH